MKFLKIDYLFSLGILIISLLFCIELFLFPGRPANFDSNFHITNIAQFSNILKTGEFPVIWLNNFANYGLPMGIFAHQLTNYLGGFLNIIIQNPTTTYNFLVFLGVFLTNIFLYFFLKIYFSSWSSFLGVFIFNFTSNHIFNIFVRGAMPEVFSGIFVPLILISLFLIIIKKKPFALFLLSLSIAGLTLNHPMMLIVYSSLFIPYLFFLLLSSKLKKIEQVKLMFTTGIFMLLGLMLASYYILPLNLEIKYFYYGLIKDHISKDSFLGLSNFVDPRWQYFTSGEIFPRGHIVKFGLLESLLLLTGAIYAIYAKFVLRSNENRGILYFCTLTSLVILFFNINFSLPLFKSLFFLNAIQFPWRFLSALIFIPPIIAAYFYEQNKKRIIFITLIVLVSVFSFPQIYGKNFNSYPSQNYYFSKENVHSILMNTIWTGKSEDYPSKTPQAKVISGRGEILKEKVLNSSREYVIRANTDVKVVDHTFYFPGWNVYIDKVKSGIEFQNPEYRGVITYSVPKGDHTVSLIFQDTKVRFLGKILTVFFALTLTAIFILRKKWAKFIF